MAFEVSSSGERRTGVAGRVFKTALVWPLRTFAPLRRGRFRRFL